MGNTGNASKPPQADPQPEVGVDKVDELIAAINSQGTLLDVFSRVGINTDIEKEIK